MKANQAKSRRDALTAASDPPKTRRRNAAKKGNPAGRPTLEELERRKDKVMQVATTLFVREGYAATSLVDIAKSAGVATRTVYQHFGDKEAMFHSVMFARDTAAVFPPPQIGDEESLFDAMMRAADYACDVSFRPSVVDMMRLAIAESKRFPVMMQTLINESFSRFNANVKHIFDQLVARGLIRDKDTALSAEMFIHLLIGPTPLWVFAGWQASLPTPKQLSEKVELFILGRWGPAVAKNAHKPPAKRARRAPAQPVKSARRIVRP